MVMNCSWCGAARPKAKPPVKPAMATPPVIAEKVEPKAKATEPKATEPESLCNAKDIIEVMMELSEEQRNLLITLIRDLNSE